MKPRLPILLVCTALVLGCPKSESSGPSPADVEAAPADTEAAPTDVEAAPDAEADPDVQTPPIECAPEELTRQVINNAADRMALCNDGTEAAYFYRRGDEGKDQNWIIHLEGGGSCSSACSCESRWVSQQWRMTSYPDDCVKGDGIHSKNAANATFRQWTHVWIPYCSSDNHSGDATVLRDDVGLCPQKAEGAPQSWEFRGHRVVRAVVEDLADEGLFPTNSLKSARRVLFTGSSAGSGGMRRHLDWVHDYATSVAPQLEWVKGVADAAWRPVEPPPEGLCQNEVDCLEKRYHYQNAVLDESCEAAHAPEPWRCLDNWIAWQEITTPFFIYMDQADQLVLSGDGVYPDKQGNFSTDDLDAMAGLAKIVNDSIKNPDGSLREGVYVTRLGFHTAMMRPAGEFFQKYVDDISFHDVLLNWLSGEGVMSAVDLTPPGQTDWTVVAKAWGKNTDDKHANDKPPGKSPCDCD